MSHAPKNRALSKTNSNQHIELLGGLDLEAIHHLLHGRRQQICRFFLGAELVGPVGGGSASRWQILLVGRKNLKERERRK